MKMQWWVTLLVLFSLLGGCATDQSRVATYGDAPAEALAKKKKPKAPKHKPGVFDYYVLALSWSRTHCDSHPNDNSPQCAPDARHGFVVHGLWPQYERGFPENCSAVAPLSDELIAAQMDIMPSEKLIEHEWSKHGTCSGLSAENYFAALRNAFESLALPASLQLPTQPHSYSAQGIEQAILDANGDAYAGDGVNVLCSGGNNAQRQLTEVWICLTKDLFPRTCSSDVTRRECKESTVLVPPVGGNIELFGAMSKGQAVNRVFGGSYRKAVKTSFVNAEPSDAETIPDLLARLPSDADMLAAYPKFPDSAKAPKTRVAEENANVTIEGWLHTAKLVGDDNDFHVIIGSDSSRQHADFMNVEVSGLPALGDTTFLPPREQLYDLMNDVGKPPATSYTWLTPPVRVRVTGSLYFDGTHADDPIQSKPGPSAAKPLTSWEIHPVSEIVAIEE